MKITPGDELYLNQLRGACILRVVLGHLGLTWFLPPYSEFLMGSLSVLFFISGAVSYFSFLRAPDRLKFIPRRLISVTFTYYILVAIIFTIGATDGYTLSLGFTDIIGWMTFMPGSKITPYPIGQVWFIHALVIITFLAIPVFFMAERYPKLWLVPIVISLLLGFVELFYPIHKQFYLLGHNLYQPIVYLGAYCLGAVTFRYRSRFTRSVLTILFFISILFAVSLALYFDLDVGMASHSFAPDLYYIAVSNVFIFGVLIIQHPLAIFLHWFSLLNRFLLFVSKHAFSIFLIHSYWIVALEKHLGLIDVADDPAKAISKIILVILLSSLSAIPLTWLSDSLSQPLKARLAIRSHSGRAVSTV